MNILKPKVSDVWADGLLAFTFSMTYLVILGQKQETTYNHVETVQIYIAYCHYLNRTEDSIYQKKLFG